MKTNPNKLSLLIPTKDRPQILGRLLESIVKQSVLPFEILIIDGSDESVEDVVQAYAFLPIRYLYVRPPGLARQRNQGIEQAHPEANLLGFLDDDIVLEAGCIKKMMGFWESASLKIAGAGFNIVNVAVSHNPKLMQFFRLIAPKAMGKVLPSGMNTSLYPAKETYQTEWLCGGATVWRRHIFESYKFDEWYQGGVVNEDLEFSYRISRNYQLFIVADAAVQHLELPITKHYDYAKLNVVNHFYFINKYKHFSKYRLAWGYCGRIVHFMMKGLLRCDRNAFKLSLGYVVGIICGLTGRLKSDSKSVK